MDCKQLETKNKSLKRVALIFKVMCIVLIAMNVFITFYKNESAAAVAQIKYPFIDPARENASDDEYLTNIQSLRDYLQELGDKYPDQITAYYEQLNSGANIVVNKDLKLYPASLSKLALAMIVASKVESGTWNWETKFTPTISDLSSDSGELYKTVGEKPISIDSLLGEMIINSDNTAQNILRRNVELSEYNSLQVATGLEDLFDERGFVSAKEYSRLLHVLYSSSFLKRENSEKILGLMAKGRFHDYLSQGIPSNVVFAHKYGENSEFSIFADSGIVYDNNQPYILTVLLKGKNSTEATRQWAVNLMKEISQKAYKAGK